jgi:rubredoxin
MVNANLHVILNHKEVFHLLENYTCAICGHMYDPQKGEPLQNIPPGKEFSELPDDWQCPVCGAAKKFFKREQ